MSFTVINRNERPDWPNSNGALNYEWDMEGANTEWRQCVTAVVTILRENYHVVLIDEPEFTEIDDFVEIKYQVDGNDFIFSNDALLNTIWLICENELLLKDIEASLSNHVGWFE